MVWADEITEEVIEEVVEVPEETGSEEQPSSPPPPVVEETVEIENEAVVEVETTAESNTGVNTQEGAEDAGMETGDAVAVAESVVTTNSNMIDSEMEVGIVNVVEEEGDLLLDLDNEVATEEADLEKITPLSPIISQDIQVENEATVGVTTTAEASSGENSQETESNARMETGDAVAMANAVVVTNSNLVDSRMRVMLLNLLSEYEGNIILPSLEELMAEIEGEMVTGVNIEVENEATVSAETSTQVNTGENSQETEGDAEMKTGDAVAVSNAYNMTNTTLINSLLFDLWIYNIGSWSGQIYNWEVPGSVMDPVERLYYVSGGGGSIAEGCLEVEVENSAEVAVKTEARANTGGNSQEVGGEATMETGNAYAIANTTTVANSTLINSSLMIGGINILAGWEGNLIFAYPDLTVEVSAPAEVREGEEINYQVKIKNNGYASAFGVKGDYLIRTGEGDLGSDGEDLGTMPLRSEIGREVVTGTDGQAGKTVVFKYQVKGSNTEERETNNWVEVETRVVANEGSDDSGEETKTDAPVLEITAENNVNDFVYPGDIVIYDVRITNLGPTYADKVVLTQTFHAPNDEELSGFEVEIGSLKIGETKEVSFEIQVFETTESGDYYTISWAKGYSVSGESVDSNRVNNPVKVVRPGGVLGIMDDLTPDVLAGDGEQVLGVQDDGFIWWIPLLIQFLLTGIYLGLQTRKSKEEKTKRWWVIVMGLVVLSQFVHRQIGCGLSPTWACQRYWIWNVMIGGIQALVYWYWRWRKKKQD